MTWQIDDDLYVTGKTGLGIDNPQERLEVDGKIKTTDLQASGIVQALSFQGDGSNLTGVVKKAGDTITGALTVQNNLTVTGNVGIATTVAPTERLEVNGNVKANFFLGDGSSLTGVVKNLDSVVKKVGDTMTGPLTIQNNLTVTGNVGIATTAAPTEKLEVNGNVKATSFLGDGSNLTGVVKNLDSVVKKAGDTMTGALTVQNNLTVTGNVKATSFLGNIDATNIKATNLQAIGTTVLLNNAFQFDQSWLPNPNFQGVTYTTRATIQCPQADNSSISFHSPGSPRTALVTDGPIMSLESGAYFGGNVGIGINIPTARLHIADGRGNLKLFAQSGVGHDIGYDGGSDNAFWFAHFGAETGETRFRWDNGSSARDLLVIQNNGNIGIGTPTPTKAKVHIEGAIYYTQPGGYRFMRRDKVDQIDSFNMPYSLYASGAILAGECHAFSDERIKEIYNRSDSQEDLKTLLQIEVTDYSYKDKIAKGNGKHKKVIGQQIAKVFPQAVSTNTDVVSDILQFATLSEGWVTLTNHGLKTGERVKLIWGEDNSQIFTIEAVTSDTFQIDLEYCGDIFVYGREVNDFHVVDYAALSMLDISATQALYKIISKLQQEVETLKQQLVLSVL